MAAAFNTRTVEALHTTVRKLYYRRRQIGKLYLTHEEYLNTFVPHEARDIFRDAAPYIAPDGRMHRWEIRPVDGNVITATLAMCLKAERPCPPPIPRMPRIQGDAPKEIVDKILHWAERGGDASREFARVSKVLELLNTSFSRVAIRYYWPTILAICSESDSNSLKELVQEMQDLRTPAKLKPLPPGLAQACRLTAETIATARLIPHDVEEEEGDGVVIDITTGQTYSEPFATFYGMS